MKELLFFALAAEQVGDIAKRRHARTGLVIVTNVFGIVLLADRARRQADLLLRRIELENLERQNLADLDRVFGLLDPLVAQLGDVAKTLDAFFDLDKRAEVREAN